MEIIKKNQNNFKKILIISEVISNKIKNSRIEKKNFYNKYEKTNKISFSGMNNGNDIKPVITYISPFDKPIQLKFKTNIDIDNILLEQNNTNNTSITFETVYQDELPIDDLVNSINIYIGGIKKLNSNIYLEFNILIEKKNDEEISFNNQNKYKIIEWNLELKKYFCLCWKILEIIYMEFDVFKKNTSPNIINDNILGFLKKELDDTDLILRQNFNNFGKQINLIIILFIGIKNIFDSADNDKYLLSFNTINIISDKYIFALNYIIENLFIVTNTNTNTDTNTNTNTNADTNNTDVDYEQENI